jgi:enoyl-CoA hydratase/carnithine racemase
MTDPVLAKKKGRVALLTLNRPKTRNALSAEMVEALVAALEAADADDSIGCIVLTGAGKGFSSGGNLHEIRAMTAERDMSEAEIVAWYEAGIQRIPRAMHALDTPTVAAVHGHAVGAGCDLAAMCDVRIAAEDAVFSESFLRLGLIPGDGGAWFLPRAIGQARAREMLFTAAPVDAATALDWGLVSRVAPGPELLPAALEIAERIAAHPPRALREARRLMRAAEEMTLDETLALSARMQARLQRLEDHREAVDAILHKRAPVFRGR